MHQSRQKALELLKERRKNDMQAHYDRMQAEQTIPGPKDYLALVDEFLKNHPGTTKAQAMRMVTRKHPDKHAEWIRQVNQG